MQTGCLVSNTDVKRLNTNTVRISLIDSQLIDDLHVLFPFFNKSSYDFSKHNKNSKIQYSLSKRNKQLFLDFYYAGVIPRKSAENSEKLFIPKMKKEFISHFLRGYFDGDGSISLSTSRPNLRRVEICTTSFTLISDIIAELKNSSINVPIFREKNKTLGKNKILYVIEWVKTSDILDLKNYLYKDCTICLKRKHNLFSTFIPINKTDKNPKCKHCGSNLLKNGTRKTGTNLYVRYKCNKCKFHCQQLILARIKEDGLREVP
jgi:intein/homing endonuclease